MKIGKSKAEINDAPKNNALFRSCVSKINSTLIGNAEHFDIVMPMYNLLEYSQNYSMTSGRLWNYFRDQVYDVDNTASAGKPFNYKIKIVGKAPQRQPRPENEGDANRQPQSLLPPLNVEVIIQLKYRSNFFRFLNLPLINYGIESWAKHSVFSHYHKNIIRATFQINNAKLYVPNVNLSINDKKRKYKARI